MERSGTFVVAFLASLAATGAASAADIITIPTSAALDVPTHDGSGFDWSGFYAGVYGGVQDSAVGGTQFAPGLQLGVNVQFDFYLVGAEVAVQGLAGGTVGDSTYGQILARAGLVVNDDLVLYAAGGYGLDLGPPEESDALLGGGVELAIGGGFTVEAQYLHGVPVTGGNAKDQFTVGANFHF
jgi:outer membrane immunogenic protein